MNNPAQDAINAALKGNWNEAIELNLKIISDKPNDIDALNRLARAYAETGKLDKARKTVKKVLTIDPFNLIAKKSSEKWKTLKKSDVISTSPVNPKSFLEDPGKTKIISLIHLGEQKTLAKLDSGDRVNLNTRAHRICVITSDGKHLGKIADDLSARLRKLINMGYQYEAYVKSVDFDEVKILIRETYRPDKFKETASFPSERLDYISFTPPELVHKNELLHHEITEDLE